MSLRRPIAAIWYTTLSVATIAFFACGDTEKSDAESRTSQRRDESTDRIRSRDRSDSLAAVYDSAESRLKNLTREAGRTLDTLALEFREMEQVANARRQLDTLYQRSRKNIAAAVDTLEQTNAAERIDSVLQSAQTRIDSVLRSFRE